MINKYRFTSISFILGIIIVCEFAISGTVSAQNKSKQDSILTTIRLNELKTRQAEVQKKIDAEDRKRNQSIGGVSVETMEKMNRTQDSICLELRSQLVEIELEIAELAPAKLPTQFIQQYNQLRQSQNNQSDQSSSFQKK